mgnify:CR=1 FL=1
MSSSEVSIFAGFPIGGVPKARGKVSVVTQGGGASGTNDRHVNKEVLASSRKVGEKIWS